MTPDEELIEEMCAASWEVHANITWKQFCGYARPDQTEFYRENMRAVLKLVRNRHGIAS